MSIDRRIHARAPLSLVVQFRLTDMEQFMREIAVNISMGGMFIRTQTPHPEGARIYLQFQLEDGSKLIEGLARVVHVNGPDHEVPGMGVEFVNLDQDSRRLIKSIVDERLRKAQPPR